MDWVDDEGRASTGRSVARDGWREARSDLRPGRKPLDERLEGWVTRGRALVDGVSGTRPGTRPNARGADRPGRGQAGFEGLGRWVEGRLDWLLDDRDDWREPWQEGERLPPERWEAAPSESPRPRVPLEAISRRGLTAPEPEDLPLPTGDSDPGPPSEDWPEGEAFSVPRWRRETPPSRRAPHPLEEGPPQAPPPPGRPLPRSTRRR